MAQQSVTKIIPLTFMKLVTPKVGAKHELLFNKPATVGLIKERGVVKERK